MKTSDHRVDSLAGHRHSESATLGCCQVCASEILPGFEVAIREQEVARSSHFDYGVRCLHSRLSYTIADLNFGQHYLVGTRLGYLVVFVLNHLQWRIVTG